MRRLQKEEGATLMEFAISASVLFLFLFGIFAFCTAVYSYNYVCEAAREGSRYAMVRGTACKGFTDCGITSAQVQSYVRGLSYPGIDTNNLTASRTFSASGVPGSTVTVTVTYNFTPLIPYWPQSGKVLQMNSTSQMVISQ